MEGRGRIFILMSSNSATPIHDPLLAKKLLENLAEGVLLITNTGEIIFANRSYEEMFGYTIGELLGKHTSILCGAAPGEKGSALDKMLEGLKLGKSWAGECQSRKKDGAVFTSKVKATALEVGGKQCILLVQEDVTEKKRVEEIAGRLAAIVQASEDAIIGGIPDGTITSWNPGAERLYGYTASEAIGNNLRMLAPDPSEMAAIIQAIADGKPFLRYEAKRVRRDGSEIHASITTAPLKDSNGRIIGGCSIARDITEQKRSEETLKRYKVILENMAEGVNVSDENANILYTNPAFDRMFGYAPGELVGRNVRILNDYDSEENERLVRECMSQVMSEGCWQGEFRNRRKDGSRFFTRARIQSHRLMDRLAFIAVQEDITERRRTDEALQKTTVELLASNRDLNNFAYVVSHDLQEPLRMVTSFLRLLESKIGGQLDGDSREYIRFAKDGAQRMREMIEGVLAYSRVGGKPRQFLPTDLQEVLRAALDNLKLAIAESGARINFGPLPTVPGESVLLTQLFQNLISNAIKFRSDETPTIRVQATEDTDSWRIELADNGIGFSMDASDRIFMMFQRLHTREKYAGIGAGLAICQRIVEHHGGRIWAEAEPDKGSWFFFTLPKHAK